MLKRYVIATYHGEGDTLWYIMDTEDEDEDGTIISYRASEGRTFGEVYTICRELNEKE